MAKKNIDGPFFFKRSHGILLKFTVLKFYISNMRDITIFKFSKPYKVGMVGVSLLKPD